MNEQTNKLLKETMYMYKFQFCLKVIVSLVILRTYSVMCMEIENNLQSKTDFKSEKKNKIIILKLKLET